MGSARQFWARFLVFTLSTMFLVACRASESSKNRVVTSVDMTFSSYVSHATKLNPGGATNIVFPVLQVYAPSGELIFTGHNSEDNARVLSGLPKTISKLSPVPGAPPLSEVLKDIPQLSDLSGAVRETRKPTIFSTVLEQCHACSVQEGAVEQTRDHLQTRGVNVLTLEVMRQ